MSNSVFILWLENVDPELFSAVPSLQQMAANGVDIHLTPQPLTEKRSCYYQTLTGMGPGKFGHFDSVKPVAYHAHHQDEIPDGVLGRLLPDKLRVRGLTVAFMEMKNSDELDAAAQLAQDCTIARVPAENNADAIEDLVKRCMQHLASGTHLLVLTDVWHEPAAKFVNVNNFLADIGLLEVGTPRTSENIAWTETLAYYLGSGQIWVNLRGREPQGSVASGREYQHVCEAIQQELSVWYDPDTSAAILNQVLKKDDAYTGDYLFKAPDLIVEYHPGYAASPRAAMLDFDTAAVYAVGNSKAGKARTPYARLVASGPNLVNGHSESARLVDIMPNVMYLLGQPAPGHVDGKVISTLFTPSHRQQHPQEHVEDDESLLTSEEEGHIEDRLRALGYLG